MTPRAGRGGAVISDVHANFIVTEGEDACAADALALAEEIRERIRRERGIELEYEVELWRGSSSAKKSDDESVSKSGDETAAASGGGPAATNDERSAATATERSAEGERS